MNYPFTYDQLIQLVLHKIIPGDVPVSLWNGNIVKRDADSPEHAIALAHAAKVLTKLYPNDTVFVNHPLFLNQYSVVVPDLMVVRGKAEYSPLKPPTGTDTIVVIELTTNSSRLEYDKMASYARNAVNHYWIINTHRQDLECLGEAQHDLSRYATKRHYADKEHVPLLEIAPLTQLKVGKLVYKAPKPPKGPKPNGVPKADETAST
jgi:Uma2 family endonuclease